MEGRSHWRSSFVAGCCQRKNRAGRGGSDSKLPRRAGVMVKKRNDGPLDHHRRTFCLLWSRAAPTKPPKHPNRRRRARGRRGTPAGTNRPADAGRTRHTPRFTDASAKEAAPLRRRERGVRALLPSLRRLARAEILAHRHLGRHAGREPERVVAGCTAVRLFFVCNGLLQLAAQLSRIKTRGLRSPGISSRPRVSQLGEFLFFTSVEVGKTTHTNIEFCRF